jgi:hypothetical protein
MITEKQIYLDKNGLIFYKGKNLKINYQRFFQFKKDSFMDATQILENLYNQLTAEFRDEKIELILEDSVNLQSSK